MKNLTEAQVMGFRGAMVPPTRRKYHVDAAPSSEQAQMARNKASTRRAIEEYQEQRALRLEQEL
ncbi:PA3496 family putative envelope integrity protein [Aeromonas hydrophila]